MSEAPATSPITTPVLLRRLLAGLVFGFIVLLFLMLLGDIRQVSQLIFSFRWVLYPLVLALTLFNYTLRFIKWHYYVGQIGVTGYPAWRSARLFVAGFPLAVTPGKVGEVFKAIWLHHETGAPTDRLGVFARSVPFAKSGLTDL